MVIKLFYIADSKQLLTSYLYFLVTTSITDEMELVKNKFFTFDVVCRETSSRLPF
jgi:hypothetical protein